MIINIPKHPSCVQIWYERERERVREIERDGWAPSFIIFLTKKMPNHQVHRSPLKAPLLPPSIRTRLSPPLKLHHTAS